MSDRRDNGRGGVRYFLTGLFSRAFRARPKISIGKWAEREKVKIPAEESHAMPGDYRENVEPTATIIHKFLIDPRYSVFIGPKPSRMGMTLAAIIAIAYWLAHYTCDIIFCIDDQRQVKKFAKKRLIPLLRSVKALSDIMPESNRKLTNLVLWLKDVTLYLGGARSIADVTSVTAGLVIGDEVDQWKDFATGEASAFWHLLDRIMDVPGAKAIFFGKPRNESDLLWTQMMTGTRHQCFVPCPHCGFMQALKFENLRFEHCRMENGNFDIARVKRETYYVCASPECQQSECKGIVHERHKHEMLMRHEWRQTYFGDDPDYQLDPEKMSILPANQLYSLRPKLTWGNIASHFITARKEGGTALAHFFRTRFGEPERKAQAITKKEEILALSRFATVAALQQWWKTGDRTKVANADRKPYRHGQSPFKPAIVVMFSDVQTVLNEKKWVKLAFHKSGAAAIVDYGITMSFASLIPEADREVEVLDWEDTPEDERVNPVTAFCWIDEGGGEKNEISVREFCARPETEGRFFPCKGAGGIQIRQIVEEHKRKVTTPEGDEIEITAYHFSHDAFATELVYNRIKKHEATLMAIAQGVQPEHQPLWCPEFPDDQFVMEMCSERLVQKRIRGRTVWIWEKSGKRINDFSDGVKGCFAMWHDVKSEYMDPGSETEADSPDAGHQRQREYELHH